MVVADDDRVDGRYLEVHQGVLHCSRARRRSPAICGSSRRCCTSSDASSGWAISASNIAKLVPLSGDEPPKDKEILDTIERMGQLARAAGRPG